MSQEEHRQRVYTFWLVVFAVALVYVTSEPAWMDLPEREIELDNPSQYPFSWSLLLAGLGKYAVVLVAHLSLWFTAIEAIKLYDMRAVWKRVLYVFWGVTIIIVGGSIHNNTGWLEFVLWRDLPRGEITSERFDLWQNPIVAFLRFRGWLP